jgi:hypothetical protein
MPPATALLFLALLSLQPSSEIWLDQPLTNWNKGGAAVPAGPAPEEPLTSVLARCRQTPPAGTVQRLRLVGGKFAGTLSPTLMTSRADGSSGEVRLSKSELTVEYNRYAPRDPLCCPSARESLTTACCGSQARAGEARTGPAAGASTSAAPW